MIDILKLSDKEIKALCGIIGYNNLKRYFNSNPKPFSQIKPGFRAKKLKPEEIDDLICKHRDKPFISSWLYSFIEATRDIIQEARSAANDDLSYEEALALIEAGASRIGASAGIQIVRDAED